MKKILFSLVALVCSMSMNAQVMKVMKNGEEVATYKGAEYTVVFEEEPASTPTGTAVATIGGNDVNVGWSQLWAGGPKFAEFNVGVTDGKAESFGGYYCWGGSIDQDPYGAFKSGTDALTGDDDTATKLWGSAWRMPTQAELEALLANCDVEWTAVNGVNGSKFTGKGDYASYSVFLPAAGACNYGNVNDQGSLGYYWSSTLFGYNHAYYLGFFSGYQFVSRASRDNGYSVRAVLAE
ncbi:MAG: hypothetical protein KBT12_03320 [Bacteroidales bacterium]|nr:hypothetical protein [Candidatus Physcousia equi]